MEFTETTIEIEASPQLVWSILDDLPRYGEWNPILPAFSGRTTVGETVSGDLVIPGMPVTPIAPAITRIVPARELRWKATIPGDAGFTAEHIFLLSPSETGTCLVHREEFDGPAAPFLAEAIAQFMEPAYINFNLALKTRAEELSRQSPNIHPALNATSNGEARAETGKNVSLKCACSTDQVMVEISAPIYHNHLCGCSKCWKPEDSLFAQIAVVPSDSANVVANGDKLELAEPEQVINRSRCSACGTHMIGSVKDPLHHFYGLSFVHPELASDNINPKIEFAAFCSSIVENGASASVMQNVREKLTKHEISCFDAFTPEIMDIIAYHKRKISTV